MTLADYFLPVKGGQQDPVSGDLNFYRKLKLQMEGLNIVVSERKFATNEFPAPTPPLPPGPLLDWGLYIENFRADVEASLGFYLNTDIYPGGSIAGETLVNVQGWTLSTILASLGLGVGGTWTRTPAGNPFGFPAAGGSAYKAPCYKQQMNEIVSVCQALKYTWKGFFVAGYSTGLGDERFGDSISEPDCASAKSAASDSWDASGWVASVNNFSEQSTTVKSVGVELYSASLTNNRGYMKADFTPTGTGGPPLGYPSLVPQTGSLRIWAYFAPTFGLDTGSSSGFYGNNTWQELDAATVGSFYTSQLLGGNKAPFPASCLEIPQRRGWRTLFQVFPGKPPPLVVHEPVFELV